MGFCLSASLGDLDGDRIGDLAVGAPFDDDGGNDRGAVWMLFLNRDGTVKSHQKISDTEGGFDGPLSEFDCFGSSLAWMSDIDGDGVGDVAAGAMSDDDGGHSRGAVWVLLLNANGTVKAHSKISDKEGGFDGGLSDNDFFGRSDVAVGDLDGDGAVDLIVGAPKDDDGPGSDLGAVWVLFLDGAGANACQYTLKRDSKPRRGCDSCPVQGDVIASEQRCKTRKECEKRIKGKIDCPEGQRGSCKKIKGKRTRCD